MLFAFVFFCHPRPRSGIQCLCFCSRAIPAQRQGHALWRYLPIILSGRIRHVPGLDPGCGHYKDSGFLLSQKCPRAFIPSFRFLRQAQDRQGSQRRRIIGLRIKTKILDSRLQLGGMTEKEEEKDPGFPITNVGNDREGKTGMTEKEEEKDPGFPIKNVGNDREGKTEMTEREKRK